MSAPIGIIAGHGRLPLAVAQGIRAAGHPVACVGLLDSYDGELPGLCDRFDVAAITRMGRWIRLFRRWGVSEAIMVGSVAKTRMYDPFKAFRYFPDWRAAKVWYGVVRHDRRSDRLLGAVAGELARSGVTLMDSTTYIPQLMADAGVMTRHKPSAAQRADIEFGLPIVRQMGGLDIGQSLAVKDREVIAVEAMEGTAMMIQRAGELCKKGDWVLIKIAKPNQDMRFDVPTVGLLTIEQLQKARSSCLAVEAGKTILLDKEKLLAAADEAGIAVVGIKAMGVGV